MPFDSRYLKRPVVDYDREETRPKVSLICKIELEKDVNMWENVTYEIEWFVNRISKVRVRIEKRCNLTNPAKSENDFPCPGKRGFVGSLATRMPGELYKLGVYVRLLVFKVLTVISSLDKR